MRKCKLLLFLLLYVSSIHAGEQKFWSINVGFEALDKGSKALGSGGFWGGAGQSEISMQQTLEGKSAKIWIHKNQTGYGKWGGEWRLPGKLYKGDTIWFSAHIYVPENFDYSSYGEGNKLKFLRVGTKTNEGKHIGYDDLYINPEGSERAFSWIYEGDKRWWHVGKITDAIQKEQWENYQMSITFDNVSKKDGGLAEIRIWKNGKLLSYIDDRRTLKNEGDYADRALLFTYWNGGAPKKQEMYVDQIVITNTTPAWSDAEGYPIVPFFTDLCRLPTK